MRQQIPQDENNDIKQRVFLDDKVIFEYEEELLNKEYMYYPYRNKIQMIHTITENGIYQRIYWLADAWEQTESVLWNIRESVAGVTRESRVFRFCVTHYLENTLLHLKPIYKDSKTAWYLCKDQFRFGQVKAVCDAWEEFQPEWIQLDAATAELLLEYAKKDRIFDNFHFKYVEIINSGCKELCRQLQDQFGCIVKKVWVSAMFGFYAAENESGVMELLSDNVMVEEFNGRAIFSGKQNLLMPIRSYVTEHTISHTKHDSGSDLLHLDLKESKNSRFLFLKDGTRLCADIFHRPVEFINEKAGRMIQQIQIIQKGKDTFAVHLGLHPAYYGWQDEIKKMFCEYLYLEELREAEYQFSFVKGLLNQEGCFFINELERE